MLSMNENQLVTNNLGLVIRIAKAFNPRDYNEMQEYIQEGSIALLKAIRKYDPSRGYQLSTLAWKYITKAILRYKTKQKKHHSVQELFYAEKSYVEETDVWQYYPISLEPRELQILHMRDKGYTFQDIGKELGYTRGWINRIYKTTINKIRCANDLE